MKMIGITYNFEKSSPSGRWLLVDYQNTSWHQTIVTDARGGQLINHKHIHLSKSSFTIGHLNRRGITCWYFFSFKRTLNTTTNLINYCTYLYDIMLIMTNTLLTVLTVARIFYIRYFSPPPFFVVFYTYHSSILYYFCTIPIRFQFIVVQQYAKCRYTYSFKTFHGTKQLLIYHPRPSTG